MNQDNLIPFNELTEEKQRELASKGGKASGEARKQKKLMREQLNMLLNLPIKSSKIKVQLKELGVEDTEMNNQMALLIAMYQKALKGDVSAFNTLRDTSGEKPIEVQQIVETPIINDNID